VNSTNLDENQNETEVSSACVRPAAARDRAGKSRELQNNRQ
jgi:hypothetical protein